MDSMDFRPLSEEKTAEILRIIKLRLDQADAEGLRRAMLSVGWLEGASELVEPLMELVTGGTPELALAALEGLSRLRVKEAEQPLAGHIVKLFRNPGPGQEGIRTECIHVLGKVGGESSVGFMAELVVNPAATEREREAAVEALVSLAEGSLEPVYGKLKELKGKTDGPVREAVDCALRELSSADWKDKGYLTIEAEFRDEDES
ncbi:MAG: HEAT repeat domain-containing protein [Candidatus Glassbacteria bacterium]|nr:HEAT repeat domain-containing protein [Candidatus Glassbacteria bacterium]